MLDSANSNSLLLRLHRAQRQAQELSWPKSHVGLMTSESYLIQTPPFCLLETSTDFSQMSNLETKAPATQESTMLKAIHCKTLRSRIHCNTLRSRIHCKTYPQGQSRLSCFGAATKHLPKATEGRGGEPEARVLRGPGCQSHKLACTLRA